MRTRPRVGRLNAITRLTSVLLPDPLEPTSAVVDPAGARNDTSFSTGTPGAYSNHTSSNATSPRTSASRAFDASSASSVGVCRISRMRSRPAKASVICVPIEAICTTGAAIRPVKKMYMMKSPRVISPATMERPPTTIITTPMMPTMTVEIAVVAETPVIDCAMLRSSLCDASGEDDLFALLRRVGLHHANAAEGLPRRPVTSALILPRSRNSGRRRRNA